MNLTETVYEISKSFIENGEYVELIHDQIKRVADDMIKAGPPKFPMPKVDDIYKGTLLELVAASVNYCYWYGRSNIRPLGANSSKMYDLMMLAFKDYEFGCDKPSFEDCIKTFSVLLSQQRFPLIEERNRHLEELVKEDAEKFVTTLIDDEKITIQESMFTLISLYPGFASDIFLKRASLFYIQLFRRFGWFAHGLKSLHVPADYQVPKMLEYFGCLWYDHSLYSAINESQLIPKNSLAECEIRAGTVLAIKELCDITGWNVAQVDGYFFLKRNEYGGAFHLTITTDY